MNIQELKDKISLITNETMQGQNTAERVGSTMNDIVDTLSASSGPVLDITPIMTEFFYSGESNITSEIPTEEFITMVGWDPSVLKDCNNITISFDNNNATLDTHILSAHKTIPVMKFTQSIGDNTMPMYMSIAIFDEFGQLDFGNPISFGIGYMEYMGMSMVTVSVAYGDMMNTDKYTKGNLETTEYTCDQYLTFMNPQIYIMPEPENNVPIILNVCDEETNMIYYDVINCITIIGNFTVVDGAQQEIYIKNEYVTTADCNPTATITEQGNYQFMFTNGKLTINKTYN